MKRARTDVKIKSLLCAEESRGAEHLTLAGVAGELNYPGTQTEVMRDQLHLAKISTATLCENQKRLLSHTYTSPGVAVPVIAVSFFFFHFLCCFGPFAVGHPEQNMMCVQNFLQN